MVKKKKLPLRARVVFRITAFCLEFVEPRTSNVPILLKLGKKTHAFPKRKQGKLTNNIHLKCNDDELTRQHNLSASKLALEHPWVGIYGCTLRMTGNLFHANRRNEYAILCA